MLKPLSTTGKRQDRTSPVVAVTVSNKTQTPVQAATNIANETRLKTRAKTSATNGGSNASFVGNGFSVR